MALSPKPDCRAGMVESGDESENERASCWGPASDNRTEAVEAEVTPLNPCRAHFALLSSLLGGVSDAHDDVGLACPETLHPGPTIKR